MSKKKPHWSAILDVLFPVDYRCTDAKDAVPWATKCRSFAQAWELCRNGYWMEQLCSALTSIYSGFACMFGHNGVTKGTKERIAYWRKFPTDLKISKLSNRKLLNWAKYIRSSWSKPPRIPKKLLKEAGLA